MELFLTQDEKITLLKAARGAIGEHWSRLNPTPVNLTPALQSPCGVFVTIHRRGSLRGCIGQIESHRPLLETVEEMARSSAFQDPRFPPLGRNELEEIDLEISVLSPFKRITRPEEIQVGVHGIMIRQGSSSGLLLPQVATEYGWDRETFLAHTCRKAGLRQDCWKAPDTVIEIFSALVFGEKELGLK